MANKTPTPEEVLNDAYKIYATENQQTIEIQRQHTEMERAILLSLFHLLQKEPYDPAPRKSIEKVKQSVIQRLSHLSPDDFLTFKSVFEPLIIRTNLDVTIVDAKQQALRYKQKVLKQLDNYFDSLSEGADTLSKPLVKDWNGVSYTTRYNKASMQFIDDLERMIKQTIVNSQRPQDFKRELSKAINQSAANADRLLRTESTGIVSATRMEQYKKDGYEKVMVLSGLTETTCSHCAAYDHTIIPISEVRIGINVPPLHPNCKCEVVPYVDEYSYSDEERAKDIERMSEKKAILQEQLNQKNLLKEYHKYQGVIGKEAMPSMDDFKQMKYNKGNEWERLKDNYYVKERLKDGRWGNKINPEKQAPHMESTHGEGKSYFYDDIDVQALFDKYAGTGEIYKNSKGRTWKEDILLYDGFGYDEFAKKQANSVRIHHHNHRTHMVPRYTKEGDKK